jgi:lon-related putative ATP-dependent protease
VARSEQNQYEFVRLMAGIVRHEKLLPFDRDAVGRVIERGSRLIGDAQKMSIHMESISNLLREADYWARHDGCSAVEAEHVQKAVDSWIYRSDRLRERMQEQIERDIVMIDTDGATVGQVNGLSVVSLGDFAFGHPCRITARIRLGKGEVVDIEREVAMGGPIHSKGVLILSGFLGGRYALDQPLSLSASLVFEQSYGGIEGDSASSAELYALLSAIADVPIRQALAVTGSVNQYGRVQPIGGVNEKIEGFFDICRSRGLKGGQGVLIPAANIQHLMLRQDVIDAVEQGTFHIHAVKTIDQGIEILTGIAAGEPDESGVYPEDTLNGKVHRRLKMFADRRMRFAGESQAQKDADTAE